MSDYFKIELTNTIAEDNTYSPPTEHYAWDNVTSEPDERYGFQRVSVPTTGYNYNLATYQDSYLLVIIRNLDEDNYITASFETTQGSGSPIIPAGRMMMIPTVVGDEGLYLRANTSAVNCEIFVVKGPQLVGG